METDQQGVLAEEEEEEEEETSCKKQKQNITLVEQLSDCGVSEIFVDKVKSTTHFQHINQMDSSIMDLHATELKAHSSNSTNSTSAAAERRGKKPFIKEISFLEKAQAELQNMRRYRKDPFKMKKQAFFGTVKEASKGFNMHESKETSSLMANVNVTESSDECNTTSNPSVKAKRSLIGVRRQKNGRYGAVVTDKIRHKQVWLGTFDTIEEASYAYLPKKSEFEKLSQQGNEENKPKKNLEQFQQSESPVVAPLSVANDQTLDTASHVSRRNERINSHKTTRHIVEVHKNKTSGKEPESSKETSCLMANVNVTESSDECNTTSNPSAKTKRSLIGVRRQKNGRYGAVVTDKIRHKQVWLGTFDTIEEASQAYLSKKSEFEKLSQQGNEEDKPKKNFEQFQQPESPVVAPLSVANDQTLDTASHVSRRNERINSHKTTRHIVEVHKNKTSGKEPESSKETSCLMANVNVTESSDECNTTSNPSAKTKRSLIGVRRQKNGRYGAVVTDKIRHKQVWLGTFDTIEEASQAYLSKKSEFEKLSQQGNEEDKPKKNFEQFQQPESPVVAPLSVANDQTLDTASHVSRRNERINSHKTTRHIVEVHKNKTSGKEPESSKETSCLMANVNVTESSDECNTTSNPSAKTKRSLIGVRRQKNGRYGAVVTDKIRHKQVWLGTFDTIEEASQAYLSKKSEFEKLSQQGNEEDKPKKNFEQFQQPESPVVAPLSVANDQTLDTASHVSRRNERINSHKTTRHIVEVHKNKTSGKEPESSKETSCLMANVNVTESSDECNTTSNPSAKTKRSLIGVRRQKNGRYGAVVTDKIRHKQVWLGTFDTIEEASQAYLSKKSEFEKLSQQGNEEDKPKKNFEQIQQPESPVVAPLSVANDQTLDTASHVSRRNERINSHETTRHIVEFHKNKTSGKEPESSKETSCLMANVNVTESSDDCNTTSNPSAKTKRSLIGVRRQKNGRYGAVVTDKIRHKQVWLGTFDTIEEASQAYLSKKSEFEKLSQQGNEEDKPKKNFEQIQQPESPVVAPLSVANDQTLDTASHVSRRNERINSHETTRHIVEVHKNKTSGKEPESSKETSCLMANVNVTESSDDCNTTSNPSAKTKRSLIGVRRQKNGRYGAVVTDKIRHKQVWLGTFDTIEEASQAYLSKKSEFEKLSQQGNEEDKPKKNFEQFQQPESPAVASLSVANDQTLDTASHVSKRNERINYYETTRHIVEVHKNKTSGKEPESSKETSCLMANVNVTESSDQSNITTSCNPKAKRSLLGVRRQKDGRYGAVITDRIRHKKVWLGTFDTIEEASQAYLSKKSEIEKLRQQGNKENKPKNCNQIQQPESPVVPSLSVANDQTLDTDSHVNRRNGRVDSHKTARHVVEVHKNKTSGKEPESSKETSCLMANVNVTESSDECNITTSCNPKAKRSLLGVRRQKDGRYGAVITDRIRQKKVWLGTFDTIEEASQAYLSKKSEIEKLRQQGNKENKPKNCDQIQHPESPVVASLSVANDQTLDTASMGRRNERIDFHQKPTHIVGVHKRKNSGKYTSEIRNPTSKKRIWLGTFGTAEEASQAYQSKKLEFQKLVEEKQQQCTNKQTHSKQDAGKEKLVNVKQGHENVNCEALQSESAGGSEIDVPISDPSNGGTDQRIDSHEIGTAEEAFHAYQSKIFDFQSSKKVELQSNMPTDYSAGEKQEGQEDGDLWMGEWVQLPGNREVKFSLKLGLPIIDNYGSLLGEFSTLDDLNIR